MHAHARHQRGSMLVFGAGILLFLSFFAMAAADIGRILVVRNELQNVADAAALSGANCLTRQSSGASPSDCLAAISPTLNWARAQARAEASLSQNSSLGTPISTTDAGHTIQVGYFNLLSHQPSGGAFNTAFSPITINDKPAVRVTVRKDEGMNAGPVGLITRVFGGMQSIPIEARAVAVISTPGMVLPGNLLPQAINKCMFDRFWNAATNSPRLYTGDNTGLPADTISLQRIGQPFVVRIGSSYHYGTCDSGQWTTFDQPQANSASQVRNLVMNGNPSPIEIGDPAWIKPGTSAANYNDITNRYAPFPDDVNVVVVDNPDLSHLPPDGRALEVVAFAGFRLRDSRGGSNKYIEGQFIPSNVVSGSGVGPSFGTYTPPRIAL